MRHPPTDDRRAIAYYAHDGAPIAYWFDFRRTALGSRERGALYAEFDRTVEALRGQGARVFTWDPDAWARGYGRNFLAGRYRAI